MKCGIGYWVTPQGYGKNYQKLMSLAGSEPRELRSITLEGLLRVSAMNRLSSASSATPPGKFSSALVAGPPSPLNPPAHMWPL